MNDDEEAKTNIFKLISKNDEPETKDPDALPVNVYALVDRDGNVSEYEGFLVFTSQHVAVMREQANGAIPIAVMPLDQLYLAELVEDTED